MESFNEYIDKNIENIKSDIARLVNIPSVKSEPAPEAPYGEGVRRAQLECMKMCRDMGFEVVDCEGRIAYAHYGNPDKFIGVIAHLDVVPVGEGWFSDPFICTERDGWLVGRGTCDDKGAFVLAAWAAKYLIENDINLNYGIRLLIGLSEETGMSDLEYYKDHYPLPVFSFTPDSGFPVGHGEKGIFVGNLVSGPVSGVIRSLSGGLASNVVPDKTVAVLDGSVSANYNPTDNITVEYNGDSVTVTASGIAKHASAPEGSLNSNAVLLKYLLDSGVLSSSEIEASQFLLSVLECTDGEVFGIACDDGIFTPLTIIGGMLNLIEGRLVLNLNSRYPTNMTPELLEQRIFEKAVDNGFTIQTEMNSKPYYLSPDYPAVLILNDIYNDVTGSDAKPYVMSGGTYARHIDNAVSYGPEFEDDIVPDWVGTPHMKNEAINIERSKQACEIYIRTLIRLQDVEL